VGKRSKGCRESRTSFDGAEAGGFLDEAVEERQAAAGFLELGVVTLDLAAEGADVFRVKAEVLKGVGDCLKRIQWPSELGVWKVEHTMEVGCTEANQIAMSSWTIP
jgi:hypothetical protein